MTYAKEKQTYVLKHQTHKRCGRHAKSLPYVAYVYISSETYMCLQYGNLNNATYTIRNI
jgi:hypothetical protein